MSYPMENFIRIRTHVVGSVVEPASPNTDDIVRVTMDDGIRVTTSGDTRVVEITGFVPRPGVDPVIRTTLNGKIRTTLNGAYRSLNQAG